MKNLLTAGRVLLLDFAATLSFMVLLKITRSVEVAVAAGLALAAAQIGWQLAHRQRIDALQWVSAGLVVVAGVTSLITHNPLVVMFKPSVLYIIAGAAMVQRGWMNRYLPPIALEVVPDLAVVFGYIWAGLMFLTAAVSLAAALTLDAVTWATVVTAWGIGSKLTLFLIQYAVMRTIGRRRVMSALA